SGFKTRQELLDDEFDKFVKRSNVQEPLAPGEGIAAQIKAVFKSYVEDSDYREAIDSGRFSDLNVLANGDIFFRLSPELRRLIPEYIKDNINLAEFGK
ncbi:MAG: hypothetical protein LBM77_12975, partial [Spirochaetaceae bacterium]|nr:hypothetical protein [Spirochaetaceae bacterium]